MKPFYAAMLLLVLPFGSRAQSTVEAYLLGNSAAGPGTYLLVDNRLKVYMGNLAIDENSLTAKEGKNKKQVWKASEVYWARIGTKRYMPVTGFQLPGMLRPRIIPYGLAELLDSGRLSLLRYDQHSSAPGSNASGGYVGPSGATTSYYLLQPATEENAATIPMNLLSGKGPEFREMLSPYFASRPDLQAQLAKGDVARRNLAAFFHAFNTGQPFVAKPEDLKDE
jgi:hypothetical protein